jgi:hypothetical protein
VITGTVRAAVVRVRVRAAGTWAGTPALAAATGCAGCAAAAFVEAADGAGIAGAGRRAGIDSSGKRTSGIDSDGSETAACGGFSAALIEATRTLEYGSDRAMIPSTPNQKRCLRVPRPCTPNVRPPPEPCAPEYDNRLNNPPHWRPRKNAAPHYQFRVLDRVHAPCIRRTARNAPPNSGPLSATLSHDPRAVKLAPDTLAHACAGGRMIGPPPQTYSAGHAPSTPRPSDRAASVRAL